MNPHCAYTSVSVTFAFVLCELLGEGGGGGVL